MLVFCVFNLPSCIKVPLSTLTKEMAFPRCLRITVLLVVSRMFHIAPAQRCGTENSIFGKMLRGHTFRELKTNHSIECLQTCNADVRCQSINYVMRNDICELNNRTKEARPENFIRNIDRYYLRRVDKRGNNSYNGPGGNCIKTCSTIIMHVRGN